MLTEWQRLLGLALALAWTQTAVADPAPADPADFGVQVQKPAGDGKLFSHGSGVLVGNGLVLTAAHVIKVNPGDPRVTLLVAGRLVGGMVVASGGENPDLALVRLDPGAAGSLPQVAVCPDNPVPNRSVEVASQGHVTHSATFPKPMTSAGAMTDYTDLLVTGYHHGDSGGGVFDAGRHCLWGIIRLEMSGNVPNLGFVDITAIVPAAEVRKFLDGHR